MVLQICNFLLNTPLTEMALAPLFFNKFAKKNKYTKKALLWTIVSNTNKLYVQIWLPNSYIYYNIHSNNNSNRLCVQMLLSNQAIYYSEYRKHSSKV